MQMKNSSSQMPTAFTPTNSRAMSPGPSSGGQFCQTPDRRKYAGRIRYANTATATRYTACHRSQRRPVRTGKWIASSWNTRRERSTGTITARPSATVKRSIPAFDRSACSEIVLTIAMPSPIRPRSRPSRRSTSTARTMPTTSGT